MRTILQVGAGALLAASLAGVAQAAPVPGPPRAITDPKTIVSAKHPAAPAADIASLYDNRASLGAAWSPDGKWVVVSANLSGRYNLWKYPAAGGAPVQLTHSNDRQSSIVVSPDGKWVVFQSDHGGDEMYDLYAVPLAGGEVVDLTNTASVSETDARFSPDGKLLAFASKPKASPITDVAVMDMATHAVRALTHEPTQDNGWQPAAWAPDGKSLIANRHDVGATVGSVWRLSLNGAPPKALTKVKARISAADISRDGRQLSIASNQKGGIDQAGLLDLTDGKVTWLAPTPWEQQGGSFSPDGATVTVLTNADGRADLSAYDLKAARC